MRAAAALEAAYSWASVLDCQAAWRRPLAVLAGDMLARLLASHARFRRLPLFPTARAALRLRQRHVTERGTARHGTASMCLQRRSYA